MFRVEPVVVTGRRSEEVQSASPVAVQVIDREQIVTSGARDAAQILSVVAGVQLQDSFAGTTLRMQGLDPQHVLILVDGERLVGARDGAFDLTRFFSADIERIEIVRGPASALYGSDAMAGVINIITRPGSEDAQGEALARYGCTRGADSFGDGLGQHGDLWVSAGAGTKKLRARLAGSYRNQAGFDLTPETLATTGADLESFAGQLRVDYLPTKSLRVPLNVRALRRDQNAVDESGSGAVYDRITRTDEVSVILAPQLELGVRDALTTSLAYSFQRSQYVRDQRGDDDGDTFEDAREQLGTLRGQYETWLADPLLVTAGIELLGQRFDSPRLDKLGRRGRISPYGQLDVTLTDRPRIYAAIVPSVRVDFDSQYGTSASPRVSLRVDPIERLALRAGFGRGFRAPNFTELLLDFQNPAANYRVAGNEDLRPESSVGGNVELELRHWSWFDLTVNLYRNDVRDLIDTALVAVEGGEQVFSYVNVLRARSQGVEGTWSIHPTSWLTTDLMYTFTHARDLQRNRDLPGRSRHRGSARVVFGGQKHDYAVSVRAVLAGKSRFYTDTDASGMPSASSVLSRAAYVTFDCRASYRFDFIEPFVSAENLSNENRADLALRPMSMFVGVTVNYPSSEDEAP